jgi:glycolate oxidase
VNELIALLGTERVLTAPEDLIPYSFDGTAALKQRPRCVVFAKTAEEVAAVLKFASGQGVPVVTRGSGTGLSGGSLPVAGGIVLCLAKMDQVLKLDEKNLTVLVETGVITQKIAELADTVGLLYPPDPGSMKISTIGGNVAENSGGLRGLKYGVTRDYVMGLEVVLADGRILWLGSQCVKDVAGYSIKDVFIGSEGTLGVITKVLLKLVPKPRTKKTLLATFSRMDAAAETVSAIIADKIIPCTLEFLDKITIKCVEDFAHIGLPLDAEALLLMETDGHPAVVEEEARRMEAIARQHGADSVTVAQTAEEANATGHGAALGVFRAGARRADNHSGRRDRPAQRTGEDDPFHAGSGHAPQLRIAHVRPHGRRQSASHVSHRRTQRAGDGPRRARDAGNF